MAQEDVTLRENTLRRLRMFELDHNFSWLRDNLGGIQSLVFSEFMDLKNNGNLPFGKYVRITDRGINVENYADGGMLVYCPSTTEVVPEAIASFYVADYQMNSQGNNGVWYLGLEQVDIELDFSVKPQYKISLYGFVDLTSFSEGDTIFLTDINLETISSGIIVKINVFDNTIIYQADENSFPSPVYLLNLTLGGSPLPPYSIISFESFNESFVVGEYLWADNGTYAIVTEVVNQTLIRAARNSDEFFGATNLTGSISKAFAGCGIGSRTPVSGFVIWNNIHYLITDSTKFNSQSPNINTDAYSPLELSLENGYHVEWDEVIYNFNDDLIRWRKDKRGNIIPYYNLNESAFQWGDDNIHDYTCEDFYSTVWTNNNRGEITGKQIGNYTYVYVPNNLGYVYVDVNGTYQALYCPDNYGSVEAHIRGFSSGLEAERNRGAFKIYIEDSSYVYVPDNFGEIYAKYSNNSYVEHNTNFGNIMHCNFDGFFGDITNWSFNNISLDSEISHSFCTYTNNKNVFKFPSSRNYSNCSLTNTGSTFYTTLDITSMTTLDLGLWNFCGVFKLKSQSL